MQEAGDHLLFVEPGPRCEKSSTLMRLSSWSSPLSISSRDRIGHRGIGGLFQHGENWASDVAHGSHQPRRRSFATALQADALRQRGVIRNIGERSGCVVTTPTGITGSLSISSTRNAPIDLGQRQRRLDQREMRADADPRRRRRTADRRSDRAAAHGGMKRAGMKAFGSRQSFSCRCSSHGAIRITSFFFDRHAGDGVRRRRPRARSERPADRAAWSRRSPRG